MARKVEHEITLIAWLRDDEGKLSICDIIETSRHYASHFARGFYRMSEVAAISACAAGAPISAPLEKREIVR